MLFLLQIILVLIVFVITGAIRSLLQDLGWNLIILLVLENTLLAGLFCWIMIMNPYWWFIIVPFWLILDLIVELHERLP